MPTITHRHGAARAPSDAGASPTWASPGEPPLAGGPSAAPLPGPSEDARDAGEAEGDPRERRAARLFTVLAGLITGTWAAVLIWAAQSLVFS
ncbi:hypothetical protein [Salinarimonas soli]|uniref:Uncharacterized protein n=1 Tax=Salinarimonas soli TaxID=1638099 RepID=A0A5B2UZ78_9HYPH|nr:hypothetical protein [Salinarimonas soli]KAA2231325.1 hypothetical protein F0L46_25280 [Salinarimonas soli]